MLDPLRMEQKYNILESYVLNHSEKEPDLLQLLSRQTHLKFLQPRMLSGALQGRVLAMLSKLAQPKIIVEVGTFTGYSALCLAEGMTKNGVLHTIDINEELYDFQREFFNQSPYGHQIKQHLGDAIEILPKISGPYDLVFLDADKVQYEAYLALVINKIRAGGLLIIDNVLWDYKVLKPTAEKDLETAAIKRFNQLIQQEESLENVLLPIRDGLMVCRKI